MATADAGVTDVTAPGGLSTAARPSGDRVDPPTGGRDLPDDLERGRESERDRDREEELARTQTSRTGSHLYGTGD